MKYIVVIILAIFVVWQTYRKKGAGIGLPKLGFSLSELVPRVTKKKIILWSVLIIFFLNVIYPGNMFVWKKVKFFFSTKHERLITKITETEKNKELNSVTDELKKLNKKKTLSDDEKNYAAYLADKATRIEEKYSSKSGLKKQSITQPTKKEKWVFGFNTTPEERKEAAGRGVRQKPWKEYPIIRFEKRSDNEILFSYMYDEKTTREFLVTRDQYGFLSGGATKGEYRTIEVSLLEDPDHPGNYKGFMLERDVRYPKVDIGRVSAYLRKM